MKKIIKTIKKVVFSFFIIYGFNMISIPLNINIPINILNLTVVSLFGLPCFLSLIVILIIAF